MTCDGNHNNSIIYIFAKSLRNVRRHVSAMKYDIFIMKYIKKQTQSDAEDALSSARRPSNEGRKTFLRQIFFRWNTFGIMSVRIVRANKRKYNCCESCFFHARKKWGCSLSGVPYSQIISQPTFWRPCTPSSSSINGQLGPDRAYSDFKKNRTKNYTYKLRTWFDWIFKIDHWQKQKKYECPLKKVTIFCCAVAFQLRILYKCVINKDVFFSAAENLFFSECHDVIICHLWIVYERTLDVCLNVNVKFKIRFFSSNMSTVFAFRTSDR